MKIGYIGLGLMGGPLARNLIRAGKEVKVFDLNEESIKRTLAVGTTGVGVKSADELADCDVVFTSLPLPVHIKSTMIGENGLLNKMKEGSVYIDVSTIDPQTAQELEDFAAAYVKNFVKDGWEPHFVIAYGDIVDEVKIMCNLLKIRVFEY